jgi:hypothetical protein
MRCVKPDVAYVDIRGKRDTFKFELGKDYAMLRDRKEVELEHLNNKKMPLTMLLPLLSKSGIHLLP